MIALVRIVHASVVGVAMLVAAVLVVSPAVRVALAIVAPVAVLPWVFMPMLERGLTWLQEKRS